MIARVAKAAHGPQGARAREGQHGAAGPACTFGSAGLRPDLPADDAPDHDGIRAAEEAPGLRRLRRRTSPPGRRRMQPTT